MLVNLTECFIINTSAARPLMQVIKKKKQLSFLNVNWPPSSVQMRKSQ